MKRYNPKEIEPKWQKVWEETKLYQVAEDPGRKKYYELEYFPYPSGATMHVGHVRNYAISDVWARFMRMRGYNVLHPMGWDSFGLPAENFAIKTGTPPRKTTDENIKTFKRQLQQMGFSYDWSREIDSSSPEYYRWTQWCFLFLYKQGLAYQATGLQNWCPKDQTVLANEQVLPDGTCERCGTSVEKKELKQWYFKITDYADRLIDDLDDVDWPENIKQMQRNWIGKSEGIDIEFPLNGSDKKIVTYTKYPETIFGVTYLVVAPEYKLVGELTTEDQQAQVQKYIAEAANKTELKRQATEKTKSGVFTGSYAVNPVNGRKLPIWVADYVLADFGTGAVMGVPAHDQRDLAFAKKYQLPVIPVIKPKERRTVLMIHGTSGDSQANWQPWLKQELESLNYNVIAPDLPDSGKPNSAKWLKALEQYAKQLNETSIVVGHSLGGPAALQMVEKLNVKIDRLYLIAPTHPDMDFSGINDKETASYIKSFTKENINWAKINANINQIVGFFSEDDPFIPISTSKLYSKTASSQNRIFKSKGHFNERAGIIELPELFDEIALSESYEDGTLINSGELDGLVAHSPANLEAIKWLVKKGYGKAKTNYRLRDWLISRQRYWGAPIPIVYCPTDGAVTIPEDQLPVELPEVKDYQPSGDGRSPLAKVESFVKTTCPKCGGPAERETDTMDGFACSSWYFLRFADPHNTNDPWAKAKADYWLPVDTYVGGAEHAVMHLLYARFWTKAFYDAKLVKIKEPFSSLRNQGMIGGADGRKMGKRYGNAVTPDELISKGYGADSLRLFELFIAPYNQDVDWNVNGVDGTLRFLNRVWTLVQEFITTEGEQTVANQSELETRAQTALHRTMHKVTTDAESFGFNTTVAALMELLNELYKVKVELPLNASRITWQQILETLVILLAPLAPHITEELWHDLGHQESVHLQSWPKAEEEYLVDESVTIVVQVNGKVRANINMSADVSKDDMINAAKADEKVARYLAEGEIKNTIAVPAKLVNFVVNI